MLIIAKIETTMNISVYDYSQRRPQLFELLDDLSARRHTSPMWLVSELSIRPFDIYKLYSSKVETLSKQAWYWLAEGK